MPCAYCREPIAQDKRTDARYCSAACRQRAWRARQEQREAVLVTLAGLVIDER